MKRYFNTPDKNISTDEYMSDDIGYIDNEGFLFVTGRFDDIIISGGENINCRQVDDTLQSHPNILDSFSFGVKDLEWGQMLCSVIVPNNTETYSENELRTFLKTKLGDYKIPKRIIKVKKLPKNDLGKVEKNKLIEYLKSNFA